MNKTRYFALCLLFSLCYFNALAANTVHVMVVGDTNDAKIGSAVKTDIRLFDKLVTDLRSIASSNGYSLKTHIMIGNDCSPSYVNNAINSLSANNDIIIFYYTGHGGRSHKDDATSRFPRMCLGSRYADQWIKVSDCLDRLRAKGPKFILMITDCCNSYYDRKSSDQSATLYKFSGNYDVLRKLFFESTGYASITGASPGEYGWCTPYGAYLTLSFLDQLNKAINTNNTSITWQQLMEAVSYDTFETTNKLYKARRISNSQRPVYEVNVGVVNGGNSGGNSNDGNDNGGGSNDGNGNGSNGNSNPTTDYTPPVYDSPNNDGVNVNNNNNYYDYVNNNPNRHTKPKFGMGNIITFVISLLIGWLLIKKVPELLNLDGIISLIVKVIGVIIVVRALLALF